MKWFLNSSVIVVLGFANINVVMAEDNYFWNLAHNKCYGNIAAKNYDNCVQNIYLNGLKKIDNKIIEISNNFDNSKQIHILLSQQNLAWRSFIEKDCKIIEKTTGIGFYGCLIDRLDERYKIMSELGSV